MFLLVNSYINTILIKIEFYFRSFYLQNFISKLPSLVLLYKFEVMKFIFIKKNF